MIEIDRGHSYQPECYPAEEKDTTVEPNCCLIEFRKRIGEGYPGNKGLPHNGTSTQELLRIIIKRSIYVDGQVQHQANKSLIERCRQSIYDLEERAALRRGYDYYRRWVSEKLTFPVEDIPPCKVCGHIFCDRY